MKFATTTMLLGCAAAGAAVLQFTSIDNCLSSIPVGPDIRQAFSRLSQPLFALLHRGSSHGRSDVSPERSEKPGFPHVEMPKAELMKLIHEAALRHNVPPAFVKSIVAAESNFDPNAISPKGAIGPMQLMPDTAEEYGADPTVPAENIDAGTHYLRVLMDRYHDSHFALKRVIAAYNAGPGTVDRYRGIPPFRETRQYVARVLGYLRHFETIQPGQHGTTELAEMLRNSW